MHTFPFLPLVNNNTNFSYKRLDWEDEMNFLELLFIAIGLSMDAFAVAVCKGLSIRKVGRRQVLIVGLYFGSFQALMPLVGYFVGALFADMITAVDHWIAFFLLGIIGVNMIREGLAKNEDENLSASDLSAKAMLPLAIATSIDALAVGVSFAFLKVQILPAVGFIGIITLILSMAGVKIGNLFGTRLKAKAELAGGLILILMGIKILLEHLNVITF